MEASTQELINTIRERVTFSPGCADKRFIRQFANGDASQVLTDKQLMYLGSIKYRYRKQLEGAVKQEYEPATVVEKSQFLLATLIEAIKIADDLKQKCSGLLVPILVNVLGTLHGGCEKARALLEFAEASAAAEVSGQ